MARISTPQKEKDNKALMIMIRDRTLINIKGEQDKKLTKIKIMRMKKPTQFETFIEMIN